MTTSTSTTRWSSGSAAMARSARERSDLVSTMLRPSWPGRSRTARPRRAGSQVEGTRRRGAARRSAPRKDRARRTRPLVRPRAASGRARMGPGRRQVKGNDAVDAAALQRLEFGACPVDDGRDAARGVVAGIAGLEHAGLALGFGHRSSSRHGAAARSRQQQPDWFRRCRRRGL